MLTKAPISWLVMANALRPVATSSFSSMHCRNKPMHHNVQMER